jgi:hypothetical protein
MQFVIVDFLLKLILILILADIVLNLLRKHLEISLCFDFYAMYVIWM